MVNFLGLIDVNAGGFRLKKGPGNLTPKDRFSTPNPQVCQFTFEPGAERKVFTKAT